jgi:hypothetical protein
MTMAWPALPFLQTFKVASVCEDCYFEYLLKVNAVVSISQVWDGL